MGAASVIGKCWKPNNNSELMANSNSNEASHTNKKTGITNASLAKISAASTLYLELLLQLSAIQITTDFSPATQNQFNSQNQFLNK